MKQQQHQLDVKDDQISELNEQLKMAQVNLNQSQQLQLNQAKQLERLQAPQNATGDVESSSSDSDGESMASKIKSAKITTSDKPVSDESKAKKDSWWRRLFGRN